jgi:hypothetical protein
MDTHALCFSLLLCTAALGQPTPVITDPNCATRCSLYNQIATSTNSVGQVGKNLSLQKTYMLAFS